MRTWFINGESLVSIRFGGAVGSIQGTSPSTPGTNEYELGLALGPIRVMESMLQKGVHTDEYGPVVPAEVYCQSIDAIITMDLVHYDPDVLDACVQESIGGVPNGIYNGLLYATRAGTLLGNGFAQTGDGNHFMVLGIDSGVAGRPYQFPTTYLFAKPVTIPLGTEKSVVQLQFRAIPYSTPSFVATSGISYGEVIGGSYIQEAFDFGEEP